MRAFDIYTPLAVPSPLHHFSSPARYNQSSRLISSRSQHHYRPKVSHLQTQPKWRTAVAAFNYKFLLRTGVTHSQGGAVVGAILLRTFLDPCLKPHGLLLETRPVGGSARLIEFYRFQRKSQSSTTNCPFTVFVCAWEGA